jgi:hypothetical protein
MWATLKHKFVLSFLGIYEKKDEMFLVSPYMENGTLAQWRKKATPSVAETRERVWFFVLLLFIDAHLRRRYWKWPKAWSTSTRKPLFMVTCEGYSNQ